MLTGGAKAFLEAAGALKQNIDADLANNVVALWHDESHLNRYIIDHPDYRMLSPAYCYPEGYELPFECKILVRQKRNWIDINSVKK